MVHDGKTNVLIIMMNQANLKKACEFLYLELDGSQELTPSHCTSGIKVSAEKIIRTSDLYLYFVFLFIPLLRQGNDKGKTIMYEFYTNINLNLVY